MLTWCQMYVFTVTMLIFKCFRFIYWLFTVQMADKDFELSQLKLRLSDAEKQLSETDTKYKCELQKLRNHNQELAASLETALSSKEKTNLPIQGTPHRNNQIPGSINGDFTSDVGSLVHQFSTAFYGERFYLCFYLNFWLLDWKRRRPINWRISFTRTTW